MKTKILKILEYLLFIIIPTFSVFLCRAFRVAQGEKNEEIVFGVMVGIAIDLIYSIILLLINKKFSHTQTVRNRTVLLIAILLLLASYIGISYSDYSEVAISFDKPKFCISTMTADDGGSGKYIGLGYSFDIDGHLESSGKFEVDKYTYKIFGITIKQGEANPQKG